MNLSRTTPVLLLAFVIILMPVVPAAPSASLSVAAGDTLGPAPNDLSYYISEGKTAVNEGNWTEAVRVTTRGRVWYPQDPELLCLQAYAFRKTGEYQKAVDSISRAIAQDPRAVRYANRGYAWLALKNYSGALADADAGIEENTSYTTNYAVRALALQGLGQIHDAAAASEIAISQSPQSAHYWHVRGRILAAGGSCAAAREALEKSIALNTEYTLPWPGFGSAEENLAALNSICIPVTLSASPAPTTVKSSNGWAATAGLFAVAVVARMRK